MLGAQIQPNKHGYEPGPWTRVPGRSSPPLKYQTREGAQDSARQTHSATPPSGNDNTAAFAASAPPAAPPGRPHRLLPGLGPLARRWLRRSWDLTQSDCAYVNFATTGALRPLTGGTPPVWRRKQRARVEGVKRRSQREITMLLLARHDPPPTD